MPFLRTIDSGAVTFEAKVAFLALPGSYPEGTSSVEMTTTHMSCVFLTDRHAYKLKKPVCLPYVDYTSLPARERFCADEVSLNRPLAPGVYLGTVPLVLAESGDLQMDGPGEVVDWLVKMRRLPLEERLDTLIARDAVDRSRLERAIAALTAFYASSERAGFDADAYRARLAQAIERNRGALAQAGADHLARRSGRIMDRQLRFVVAPKSPVAARAEHVLEAHGDLRPEHVYLVEPPLVVDRLEFDRDLRLLDPADELAFLSLECERLGAPWVAELALRVYGDATGDRPSPAVFGFYRSLRACMRARLALGHLERRDGRGTSSWHELAASYIDAADTASRELTLD
jgi:aminoglycoside phosphotransferase family enzyme